MATLQRPRVEYRTPVDLLDEVRAGRIRVPSFQRGFRWEAGDVVKLFDSIMRGYPIGNLLLWRHPATARHLVVGALSIDAPDTDAALWVVDGQQRITSLVSALGAAHTANDSRFRVHLDLEQGEFHTAGVRQQPPASWLPVSFLADTATWLRWVRENDGWLTDSQTELAELAAKAIREYQIPTYVVSSADEGALVEIFSRMNTTGKPLTKTEVFNALHAGMSSTELSDLRGLARVGAELGFGTLGERLVLRCVLAFRGGDVFRDEFADEFGPDEDKGAVLREVGGALRDTVRFLQAEVGIPHAKLLPYSHVVPVLVRFVHRFGPPTGRPAVLLRRWVWRGAVAGARAGGISVPDIRGQVAALDLADPLDAAQSLVKAVQAAPNFVPDLGKTNFNHAMTKLSVLGMLSAGPRELSAGTDIDIVRLLDHGSPLRTIVNDTMVPGTNSMANRMIGLAGSGRTLQHALAEADDEVLISHLVGPQAHECLLAGDLATFLHLRASSVQQAVSSHIKAMAEWGARDGRAISDILRAA